MTDQRNLANLRKLSAHLVRLSPDVPFAVDCFASNFAAELGPLEYTPGTRGVTAGPVALAVDAGVPLEGDWTWEEYSERALLKPGSKAWLWCFAPGWAQVDNSAAGVAARIETFLEAGVPANWWGADLAADEAPVQIKRSVPRREVIAARVPRRRAVRQPAFAV